MAYCTPEDISVITGEVYDGDKEDYLAFQLETIEILIDNLITDYGKDPAAVPLKAKKMVSQYMGAKAADLFQVDTTIISQSLASGDSSESETRVSAGSPESRFGYIEPIYLKILGLKPVQITSARTETRW